MFWAGSLANLIWRFDSKTFTHRFQRNVTLALLVTTMACQNVFKRYKEQIKNKGKCNHCIGHIALLMEEYFLLLWFWQIWSTLELWWREANHWGTNQKTPGRSMGCGDQAAIKYFIQYHILISCITVGKNLWCCFTIRHILFSWTFKQKLKYKHE